MPGNRKIYEQAMQMGHNAAWDQEWDKAIAAYGRAVQELPEDPAAHNSLGLALLKARRLEDALKVYTRAYQLAPDDPIPMEKSADVLERLGRLKEAAQQYVNVAEIYLSQRDLDKAISNWERATQLSPGLIQIHQRLALAYERTGRKKTAVHEYLTLAFSFQQVNRIDLAEQAVERALRLDANHPQALNTLQAIKSGTLISADLIAAAARDDEIKDDFDDERWEFEDTHREVGESDPRGPIGEATELGLEQLANHVFESGTLSEGSTHAIQAIDMQRQGDLDDAIDAYKQALAGDLKHTAVYMNLGALQLDQSKWKDALKNLSQAATDHQYTAGAMHGMSMANQALDRPRDAAQNLLQALKVVDVDLALDNDEAAQIISVYDRLLDGLASADELLLGRLVETFLKRLTGPTWKQRVAKSRRQLEEEITLDKPEDLIETMIYIDEQVTEGLSLIDQYVNQGMLSLAMDQAHYIVESAPEFLPAHQRIGQILLERNNIPEAMIKYNYVAEVYELRGDMERAISILREALKIAPMDIQLHQSMLGLLKEQQRWPEVLNQYIDLADAYYQLGDLDAARSTYENAIRQAEEQQNTERLTHLLHRMAEIDVQRLDLRHAMRTYEQIRRTDPSDDRARRALVDLNYRLNDSLSAIRELDGLLRVYAREHRAGDIIRVLEEQVTRYPKDMALRSRLAAVYRQTGKSEQAVEQLDALAELQLEAGMHQDAIVTVKRIVALNPPEVNDYKRLLQQLSG